MKWPDNHAAFMKGFADGFRGDFSTIVENRNTHYERGFITGLDERRHKERESKIKHANGGSSDDS